MNVAKVSCVEVDCKRKSMLAKFRGGAAELQIEAGRWCGASLRTVFTGLSRLCRLFRLGNA